jgi:Tfp pilus assembly protein PilN
MFTIDLLKGTQLPPRSHPLRIVLMTAAFAVLGVATVFDAVQYYAYSRQIAVEQEAQTHYTRQIAGLADVAQMIEDADKRRTEIDAGLAEVAKALGTYTKWSDLMVLLAANTPPEVIIGDLMTRRAEGKDKYQYSLVMGVLSPSGPAAVEQFVRTLRQTLPLQEGPDSARIVSQRQQQLEGRDLLYYVIECRLKL